MTQPHPTSGRQIITGPFPKAGLSSFKVATPRRKNKPVDWTMVIIWICVYASFAALVLSGFIIRAKCRGVF